MITTILIGETIACVAVAAWALLTQANEEDVVDVRNVL